MKRILAVFFIGFSLLIPSFAQQKTPKVMLGVDVLESMNFAPIAGRRVGLLTHPAGVNRNGRATVDILHKARNVNLVALFGPEHGIYGDEKADVPVLDKVDRRTGLPVYSLYGKYRKPTPEMLRKIDVLVIDLQDVGSRSYTYVSCMIRAIEACFENDKEVVVLDRPNPLGGVKVDGPMRDEQYKSYVGMLNVPYVHGLTIGELALWAKGTDGALEITSAARRKGKLQVIPMKGWTREMLWPETGLNWVPTSPAVPSYAAAVGYAMTGLGCQIGGFQHGYGTQHPFRLLTFPGKNPAQIEAALRKANIRGLRYMKHTGKDTRGRNVEGLYVIVSDWNSLKPTEISFHLMRIACEFNGGNVFARSEKNKALLFNKHTGSDEWWNELHRKGQNADVNKFTDKWARDAEAFKARNRKFHLYK